MKIVQKPWGYEIWIAHNNKYAGKILHVCAGQRLSLQYHNEKHETLYIFGGSCNFTLGDKVQGAEPGDCFIVEPGTKHRVETIDEDCEIFEISTPELNDVVRIEDDYGRHTEL
jgi:mannose-6-phosphate isomerase